MQRQLPPSASASSASSASSKSASSSTATTSAASATSRTGAGSSDDTQQPLSSPALWRRKSAAASSPFSPSSASAANRAPVDEHAYLIRVVSADVVVFWRATRWQHVCEYSWGPRAHAALPDRYQSALVVWSLPRLVLLLWLVCFIPGIVLVKLVVRITRIGFITQWCRFR